ncbi:MAG TPA: L,D-transpeptidase [Gaiellaceae bacterium]|nr:L,D-transpeptidase [Gaiellaceae bacterium]
MAAAIALAAAAPAQAADRTQLVATLHAKARLYYRADPRAPRPVVVAARRPLTHAPTVLPVLDATMRDGKRFLRVLLPGRPNSHAGWIADRRLTLSWTPWRVVVRTAKRRVYVLRWGRIVKSFKAVVGKPSTPTPHGRFFVEEAITLPRGAAGAPYAFALSARSNVFQEFHGGPGQVAIHGIDGIGGTPGTAVSHGCIRLEARALRWLVYRIGSGTPVVIRN